MFSKRWFGVKMGVVDQPRTRDPPIDGAGFPDRTTDIMARDVFIEAIEDPDLVIQIQAQRLAI